MGGGGVGGMGGKIVAVRLICECDEEHPNYSLATAHPVPFLYFWHYPCVLLHLSLLFPLQSKLRQT
jgi:hypothetical protein